MQQNIPTSFTRGNRLWIANRITNTIPNSNLAHTWTYNIMHILLLAHWTNRCLHNHWFRNLNQWRKWNRWVLRQKAHLRAQNIITIFKIVDSKPISHMATHLGPMYLQWWAKITKHTNHNVNYKSSLTKGGRIPRSLEAKVTRTITSVRLQGMLELGLLQRTVTNQLEEAISNIQAK